MHCNTFDPHFYRRMMGIWVPLALSEAGLLDILLLAASRHLNECDQSQQEHFALLAFQYKASIVQALREAISVETPYFTDSTVIKAIMLAYDELLNNDEVTMKRHAEGAVQMVTLKGGPQTLGMDGLVAGLLFNLLSNVNQHIGVTVKPPWDPWIAGFEAAR
ncbi:uncharacterized protein APUU_41644A [Aspergillus puulaauensis]|uniref:Uncharacterized protein n=1 Tax=Aspergillus puulaauensis TaxID=1220207 RepID=A0A7R7XPD5_9EURO|nr:uncharacterized protein APUU_41644A [Aspergillus puulaauensis]BCS25200.1 hypothetical protein APUU_41644A [Aspergillus puulaauensis]